MTYLVTGATGLVGRNLVPLLLQRGSGEVFALVRPESHHRWVGLVARHPVSADRLVEIAGDVEAAGCGVSSEDRSTLRGRVEHVFHLAAAQDLTERREDVLRRVNVEGTRHAMELAAALGARCFHFVSSWGVAGGAQQVWSEHDVDTHGSLDLPQFRSKRDAERIVRAECPLPYRVYRPGMVVGRSVDGEIDSVDGIYHLFGALRDVGNVLPPWVPLPAFDAGMVNLVPVDYVAAALDELAHREGLDRRCFHLTGDDLGVIDVINELAELAHAPQLTWPLSRRLATLGPDSRKRMTELLGPPEVLGRSFLEVFGVPIALAKLARWSTRFDRSETQAALAGTAITCPPFHEYARVLWRYWEDHLDPVHHGPDLATAIKGRVVLVTGASSGIGLETSRKLARAGAHVLLVARRAELLRALQSEITADGGKATPYPTDLSDPDQCNELARMVLTEHGHVDVLVNNAGLSILRPVADSVDRLHDFQRTIAVNYLGPVALVLGLLPSMQARGSGHIVNVLSVAAQSPAPGFSAYSASKSALDAFGRSLRAELGHEGIDVTNVYMGLVHTAMSDPTESFRRMAAVGPSEAADILCDAIVRRPSEVSAMPAAALLRILWATWPEGAGAIMRTAARSAPWSRRPSSSTSISQT